MHSRCLPETRRATPTRGKSITRSAAAPNAMWNPNSIDPAMQHALPFGQVNSSSGRMFPSRNSLVPELARKPATDTPRPQPAQRRNLDFQLDNSYRFAAWPRRFRVQIGSEPVNAKPQLKSRCEDQRLTR